MEPKAARREPGLGRLYARSCALQNGKTRLYNGYRAHFSS